MMKIFDEDDEDGRKSVSQSFDTLRAEPRNPEDQHLYTTMEYAKESQRLQEDKTMLMLKEDLVENFPLTSLHKRILLLQNYSTT